MKAPADVDIDEVDAHRGVSDACLARSGLTNFDLLSDQHLRTAGLVEADGMAHPGPPVADDADRKVGRWNRSF